MSEDDDEEFQLRFQGGRLLRTTTRSLIRMLRSPPWRDLVVVNDAGWDRDAADMTIGTDDSVHGPVLPTFTPREDITGFSARLARSLAGFLEYRQDVLRRAAMLAARHHAEFLHDRGPQQAPPDDETCAREVDLSLDDLDIYTTHKVVDTPRGRLDFRSLFRVPVVESTVGKQVEQAIVAIIAAEDPSAPLSDDAVVVELAKRDIVVSWFPEEPHPIASYRGVLGIAGPEERKG